MDERHETALSRRAERPAPATDPRTGSGPEDTVSGVVVARTDRRPTMPDAVPDAVRRRAAEAAEDAAAVIMRRLAGTPVMRAAEQAAREAMVTAAQAAAERALAEARTAVGGNRLAGAAL
ncbi:hypothetical protein, partial [Thermomonospora catenispora]|uniref:hypothetical protein n=1 Tax=Thermomonospora catenispora TaxID=2493090 RepID=UPI0019D6A290